MRGDKALKVAFLSRYDRMRASSRVRVYDYLSCLRLLGWDAQVLPFPRRLNLARKLAYVLKAIRLCRWAHVIVLQKLVLREQFVDLLARFNPRLAFDFDDALWVPPDALAHDERARHRHKVQAARLHYVLRKAKAVIAGSSYLAEYAGRFTSTVHVVPSSAALEKYPTKSSLPRERVVLGWIGSPENFTDFQPVHRALRRALEELDGRAVLRIVSACPPVFDGVPLEFEPWELDRDAEFLQRFDVGLMPLRDSERSLGRCAFKAIQYMAAGLPVLASPVGAAKEVVVQGETGLLAGTEDEWVHGVLCLSHDAVLRRQMGLAARARVEALFSVQANGPRLADILYKVAFS